MAPRFPSIATAVLGLNTLSGVMMTLMMFPGAFNDLPEFHACFPAVPSAGAAEALALAWAAFGGAVTAALCGGCLLYGVYGGGTVGPSAAAVALLGATGFHGAMLYAFTVSGLGDAAGVPDDRSSMFAKMHGAFAALSFVSVLACHWKRWGGVKPKIRSSASVSRQSGLARFALVANIALEGCMAVLCFTGFTPPGPAGELFHPKPTIAPGLEGATQTLFLAVFAAALVAVAASCAGAVASGATGGPNVDAAVALGPAAVAHVYIAYVLGTWGIPAGGPRADSYLAIVTHIVMAIVSAGGFFGRHEPKKVK